MGRSRATAQMVADAADVSRVAVSRAFNPHASLKPEKRALILKVAQDLNYSPDRAARALVTRRSHLVGVIVPDVCSPWESQEIDALTTALQNEGFATLLFKTRTDLSMDGTLLTYMRGFNLDSIIVFVENVRPQTMVRVLDGAVPIYVGYPHEEKPATRDPDGGPLYDRLNVLARPGIEQAVAMLSGYGARRIAYLSGLEKSLASVARERTLRQALDVHGLGEPIVIEGDFTYDTAHAATVDLFRVGDGADAIFAANDVGAFGAIDALRHDLGLRVPGDVMVVGFDDIEQSHWKSYSLTTVKVDLDERVRALVRLILRRLKTPDAPALEETITTRLVVRGTVGYQTEPA
jgi:DNA-binding LacI/PurR family transcriptional regulator